MARRGGTLIQVDVSRSQGRAEKYGMDLKKSFMWHVRDEMLAEAKAGQENMAWTYKSLSCGMCGTKNTGCHEGAERKGTHGARYL